MRPLFGVTPRLLYAPPGREASLIQRGAQLPTNIRRGHIAGLPNSGTNFGFTFLSQNCVAPNASGTEGPKRNARSAVESQVMYTPRALPVQAHRKPAILCGKHMWLPGLHDASEWYSSASSKSSAVVVMTRHPLWWARSQCRIPWTTKIEKNRGWGRGDPQPPPCPRSLEQHPLSTTTCYNKWQAYLYQQQHNGTAVPQRNLTAARPRFQTLMHYWAAWHTAYASASANASARIFVRYEDLLLQPRGTLEAVCPLLGRVARRTLVEFDKRLSPRGQRNDTIGKKWTSTRHNASAVCDVGAAIGPYTASDLRIARETKAHMARLYGYHVP